MIASPIYTNREMHYTYTIDMTHQIIRVKITGNIHESNAIQLGKLIRQKAREINYKILIDLSEAYNFVHMGSAYFWFERNYDTLDPLFRYIPTAYIMNSEQESFYNFIQTVSMNHGINIRVFKSEESAFEWLKVENPSL